MSLYLAMILGEIVGTAGAILWMMLKVSGIILLIFTPYLANKFVFRKNKGLL